MAVDQLRTANSEIEDAYGLIPSGLTQRRTWLFKDAEIKQVMESRPLLDCAFDIYFLVLVGFAVGHIRYVAD